MFEMFNYAHGLNSLQQCDITKDKKKIKCSSSHRQSDTIKPTVSYIVACNCSKEITLTCAQTIYTTYP